ncbi:MAG: hypothetical protein ABJA81_02860 [Nocardioidaceae bacterium]
MSSHERTPSDPTRPAAWAAMGWLLVIAVTAGTVGMLSLPDGPHHLNQSVSGRELFHAEWLVLGTLVAYAVGRLARSSIVLGALGVVLSSAEMILVVDTAADRFRDNDIATAVPEFWYAVAVVQSLIFLTAGIAGARHRLSERRWEGLVHRIIVEPAATVASPEARTISPGEPDWDTRADT